jgi:hypothetical protein
MSAGTDPPHNRLTDRSSADNNIHVGYSLFHFSFTRLLM